MAAFREIRVRGGGRRAAPSPSTGPSRLNAADVRHARRADRGARPGRCRRCRARGDRDGRGPRVLRGGRSVRAAGGPSTARRRRRGARRRASIATAAGASSLRVFDMKKPMIAAINGPAVGFGDHHDAADGHPHRVHAARIGFVFARRGVVPEACSTWFLPRLVGMARAAEWVYTGRVFSGGGGAAGRPREPGGARRTQLLPAARELARGDRGQHVGDVGGPLAPAHVAAARRRPPDGGASARLAMHGVDGALGGCVRGRHGLPREAPARFTLRPSADMPPFYPWWTDRPFTP